MFCLAFDGIARTTDDLVLEAPSDQPDDTLKVTRP